MSYWLVLGVYWVVAGVYYEFALSPFLGATFVASD